MSSVPPPFPPQDGPTGPMGPTAAGPANGGGYPPPAGAYLVNPGAPGQPVTVVNKKRNPWFLIGWIVVGSFVLCGGGCAAIFGITALGASQVTTTTVAAFTGTGSKGSPAPIGTAVTPAKGWEVTVVEAEIDADATLAASNQFNEPAAGKQYVRVRVTATHTGDRPESLGMNVTLRLLGSTGAAIDTSFVADVDGLDSSAQIQPGGTITGNLVFEVPEADVAAVVLLAEPLFTTTEIADQRFLSLR